MLRNLVNRHDVARLARKAAHGQLGQVAGKLQVRGTGRVVAHWSATGQPPSQWWDVPAVQRRWNCFASGDPDVSFPEHVASKWLRGLTGLRGLSLGCGTGHRELEWARLGMFGQLTGVDLSPARVEHAGLQAKATGLDHVLDFRVAHFAELLDGREGYDVILGLQSLHHFSRIDETMRGIAQLLRPGGLLVFDEYVGPSKFQWTGSQLRAANALLASLPAPRRVQRDGRVKRRAVRPSLLSMRLDDPSEAVESAGLLPALHRWFTVLEERPYGGTVLHIALSGIAQNFLGDDAETAALLRQCFAAEDEAFPRLGHDFVFAVCAPASGAAGADSR